MKNIFELEGRLTIELQRILKIIAYNIKFYLSKLSKYGIIVLEVVQFQKHSYNICRR